jgi:hypothetical protein
MWIQSTTIFPGMPKTHFNGITRSALICPPAAGQKSKIALPLKSRVSIRDWSDRDIIILDLNPEITCLFWILICLYHVFRQICKGFLVLYCPQPALISIYLPINIQIQSRLIHQNGQISLIWHRCPTGSCGLRCVLAFRLLGQMG